MENLALTVIRSLAIPTELSRPTVGRLTVVYLIKVGRVSGFEVFDQRFKN